VPPFDYSLDFDNTDFRAHPELYRVGKGEQGVLLVEPYKSELLPLWRFRTPDVARESAARLLEAFERYRQASDFVGMDMARKFLQMGWTRASRYANHRSGRKYEGAVPPDLRGRSGSHGRPERERDPDPVKAESAAIFRAAYLRAREDPEYRRLKDLHQQRYGR
jgi:hypothetical protein